MANRRFIDFPIAASVGDNDIVLIWQDGLNKQTTKATLLQGSPQSLAGLTDVDIAGLINGQILQYNSTTSKWENVDRTDINLSELGDVTIVAPANGQVLVYNSSTGKWENSSAGYVPYTGAVTTVNLGAQSILAGSFVKAGGTAAQFLKANGSVDSTAYGTGTVTSVALSMPSAFSVGGSPITTAGTLAVTGAGTVGQYIRGDGSLADFPATTGGGSSVSYYLNGSVSQGTIGGVAYREVNRTPIFGSGTDITTSSNGYIASFITDAGDPNKLLIPAGNWNLETYFSANSGGGSPTFYVELYKYNGTTFTLIATSSGTPELIAFGTNINPYFTTLAVPETVLALTDRLSLRYYVNTAGRTITLHTENGHLCQVITTFTTGLTALNGLTSQVQFFAVGTSGTDFAISSASDTHTFNLPTASATNRGALSSADWTTFNNKTSNLGTVTSVGLSSATSGVTIGSTPITTSGTITLAIATASGSQNGLLSSTDWTTFNGKQNALTNPVTGTGTTNYLPKFTGSTTIGNSNIQDSGTLVTIGVAAAFSSTISGSYGATFVIPSESPASGNVALVAKTSNGANDIFRWFDGATTLGIFKNNGNILIGAPTDAGFKVNINSATTGLNVGNQSNSVKALSTFSKALTTGFGTSNNYLQIGAGENGLNGTRLIGFGYSITANTNQPAYIGYIETSNSGETNGALIFGTRDVTTDTAPTTRLTIASTGAATFSGDVTISKTSPTFRITRGNTSASSLVVYNTNGTDDWLIGTGVTGTNSDYRVYNNGLGADAIYIVKSNNNVGIGTASPTTRLHVETPTGNDQVARFSRGPSNAGDIMFGLGDYGGGYQSRIGALQLAFEVNRANGAGLDTGTTAMFIHSSGNVLIGTRTSGSSKLRIVGLPTSAAGLSSGDVYNLAGTLMIA